jgi:hypothetical protein
MCSTLDTVTLNVSSGASINTDPSSAQRCEGSSVQFIVQATGPSLTYQWKKDNVNLMNGPNISGVDNDTLTITNLSNTDQGIYTVEVSALCGSPQTSNGATLTVTPLHTINITPGTNITACGSQTLNANTNAASPAYQWMRNGANISGATNNNYSVTVQGIYSVIVTDMVTTCTDTSTTDTVFINALPSTINPTPANASTCINSIVELTSNSPTAVTTILKEDFNGNVPGWLSINNSTGGTDPSLAAWSLYLSSPTFKSNDSTIFVLSNSDAQGSGGQTDTKLVSPVMDLSDYSAASINFYHYFNWYDIPDTARVQYSTDGINWITLSTYDSDIGAPASWVNQTVDLSAAAGQPQVQVRFWYVAVWGFYWGIDNITITGNEDVSLNWSPQTNLYTDMGATIPYTGQNLSTVYAKPISNSTYTITATSSSNCTNSATVNINVTGDTVMNGNNSGAESLRKAIECANATDTIYFDAGVTMVNLTDSLLIDKNLTLQGNAGSPMLSFNLAAPNEGIIVPMANTLILKDISAKNDGMQNAVPLILNNGTTNVEGSVLLKGNGTVPEVKNNGTINIQDMPLPSILEVKSN